MPDLIENTSVWSVHIQGESRALPAIKIKLFVLLIVLNSLLGCRPRDPDLDLDIPTSAELVTRGNQLVNGIAACGFCHGASAVPGLPLSGGRKFKDIYGEVAAPNLTPHESGLGAFDYKQLARALRAYQGRNGNPISRKLHAGLEWISEADLLAISAYLATQAPISNVVPRREISWGQGGISGFFESSAEVVGYVPSISTKYTVPYGAYLADHVARCVTCHNSPSTIFSSAQYLKGGEAIFIDGEEKVAPDISSDKSSGIGSWSEDELLNYLKTGTTPSGREVDKRFCPVSFYAKSDSNDLRALVAYLKSVP